MLNQIEPVLSLAMPAIASPKIFISSFGVGALAATSLAIITKKILTHYHDQTLATHSYRIRWIKVVNFIQRMFTAKNPSNEMPLTFAQLFYNKNIVICGYTLLVKRIHPLISPTLSILTQAVTNKCQLCYSFIKVASFTHKLFFVIISIFSKWLALKSGFGTGFFTVGIIVGKYIGLFSMIYDFNKEIERASHYLHGQTFKASWKT